MKRHNTAVAFVLILFLLCRMQRRTDLAHVEGPIQKMLLVPILPLKQTVDPAVPNTDTHVENIIHATHKDLT